MLSAEDHDGAGVGVLDAPREGDLDGGGGGVGAEFPAIGIGGIGSKGCDLDAGGVQGVWGCGAVSVDRFVALASGGGDEGAGRVGELLAVTVGVCEGDADGRGGERAGRVVEAADELDV